MSQFHSALKLWRGVNQRSKRGLPDGCIASWDADFLTHGFAEDGVGTDDLYPLNGAGVATTPVGQCFAFSNTQNPYRVYRGAAAVAAPATLSIEVAFYAVLVDRYVLNYGKVGLTLGGGLAVVTDGIFANRVTYAISELNQWHHCVVTITGTAVTLWLNGKSLGTRTAPAVDIAAVVPVLGGLFTTTTGNCQGYIKLARVYDRVLDAHEIQHQYLEFAHRISYRDTLAASAISTVNEGGLGAKLAATLWTFADTVGTWRVVTATAMDSGKAIQCRASGLLTVPDHNSFGTWEFDLLKTDPTAVYVLLVSALPAAFNAAAQNGYMVTVSAAERLALSVVTAGVATALIETADAYLVVGTRYRLRATRNAAGVWALWILGGAHASWDLVQAAGVTTNPSAPDLTHTTSQGLVLQMETNDLVADVIHYAGALAATAPWWVVATTDATLNGTARVTLGVQFWFNWGDGSSTTYTGTGADQAIAHNYAGAGTYVVEVNTPDLADLLRLDVNTSLLVGSVPAPLPAAMTNCNLGTNALTGAVPALPATMTDFRCNDNATLSGAIPAVPASAVTLYYDGNAFTDYVVTGGAGVALSCIDFQAQDNLLPQAAVDAIIHDFFLGLAGRPGAGTLNVGGAGNAAPSAAGIAEAVLITAHGWTVTHN